ncbi:hypothetical protein UFOVP417_19 [uncultured Caudovirales phage]|uniref:Uncharacterized protein n=1 Tax=uncultured Caudovirales phage TaxID=2100421 RepID=A0A6J5M5L3_9CAUD|nr:hypothetical protein UFOVP417_19 [uncultured Caudovirales phage]
MTDRELMQQALDAMETALETMKEDWHVIDNEYGPSEGGLEAAIDGRLTGYSYFQKTIASITALRSRLAQPEQEPVAHVYFLDEPSGRPRVAWDNANGIKIGDKLYTAPPQRKPLTDEEISDLWCKVSNTDFVTADTHVFARAIEAAHGIKGEA